MGRNYEQRNMGDAWVMILTIIGALLVCLCITLLSGCKTRYITQEVPVVVHERDSIYKVQQFHTHDTLIMRDSVTTYIKGDTVHYEKWHYLQAVNNVARVDTVYKDRNIEVPVTVTTTELREVNKLHWWQKALMWLGAFAIGIGGGWIWWRIRRK